ncbi:MAG TPA: hypothetical protein PLJ65_05080, partial [Casimicrobium sp.]|nr:hypothetical protein [Casimicrobium sp.]
MKRRTATKVLALLNAVAHSVAREGGDGAEAAGEPPALEDAMGESAGTISLPAAGTPDATASAKNVM